jgi:hypothetical protein
MCVTNGAAAPYNGVVQRIVGVSALLLCGSLVAGCGASHVRPAVLHASWEPPAWLAKIVAREDRRLNDRDPHGGTSYALSKQKDVVDIFGEFTTPPPAACTTSYCPVPVRLHGTLLRLVISPRTHGLLSATLSQRIEGTQAPAIARRSSRSLRIFPARPGRTTCSIPRGGSPVILEQQTDDPVQTSRSTLRGRCSTQFVSSPPYPRGAIRVRFGERWRLGGRKQRAAWIVTVRLRDGRVQSTQVEGQPPQLWK